MRGWARAACCALAVLAACARGDPPAVQEVLETVRRGDVPDEPALRRAGAAAAKPLARLAQDRDAAVRIAAIEALAELEGAGAARIFTAALVDPDWPVRAAALRSLSDHPSLDAVPAMLAAWPRIDSDARAYMALVLGRTPGYDGAGLWPLVEVEPEERTRQAAVAALARLGDPKARQLFAERLRTVSDEDLRWAVEHAAYVGQEWLLPALAPLLDRTAAAKRVGVDGLPGPHHLRGCDVAVNLAAELSGRRFSFPVEPRKLYSDAERAEVRRFLATLPAATPGR